VAVQPDGKIIVVASAGLEQRQDIALVRYNVDGSPDTEFGAQGLVRTDFFGDGDAGRAVALQPDGKIVVLARTIRPTDSSDGTGDQTSFALVRYLPDGRLDESFASDGKTSADVQFGPLSSVALAPDGRIVVAGDAGFARLGMARFETDGTLDPTFDGDGIALPAGGPNSADFAGRGLEVQPDGKILFGGYGCELTKCQRGPWLSRFNLDGSVDPSFVFRGVGFSTGYVTLTTPDDFELLPDGKLLLKGGNPNLTRLLADGRVDPTFGCNGGAGFDERFYPRAFGVERDGGVVLAGSTGGTGDSDFALLRRSPTGAPDVAFGDGKPVSTDFGGSDVAEDVAIAPDERIVVVGSSGATPTASRVVVARYRSGEVHAGGLDCSPPSIRVLGIPRASCTRRDFTARIRINDASTLRLVSVKIDHDGVRETTRKRFERRVDVHRLYPRVLHYLNVFATDEAGLDSRVSVPFRRCGPREAATLQPRGKTSG